MKPERPIYNPPSDRSKPALGAPHVEREPAACRAASDPTAAGPAARELGARSGVPHPRLAFALLGGVQVVLILAITVITVALPAMQRDLGLSQADLALVSAGYGVSFSGVLLLGGRLADLFGRRRMFRLGIVVFGLASAAAGLAPGFWVLLAARFAQGCGAALVAPAAMAMLGVVFPDRARHARAVAAWGGLAPAGAIAGTLLSGVVVAWASWRWAFAVPVVMAGAAALAAPRLLPACLPPSRARLDLPGAVLVTAGLSAVSYGLVVTADHAWSSSAVLVPLLGGVALLAAFAAVETRARAPLVPLRFFASSRRAAALLAVFLSSAATSTTTFFLSLYFQQVRGMSPLETTAAFLPYGVTLIAAGMLASRLVARLGTRRVTVAGLLGAAAGLLLLSRMGVDTAYAGAVLAGMLVLAIGVSLSFSGATLAAVDDVPEQQAGLGSSVVNTALETGPAVGFAGLVALAAAHASQLADAGTGPASAAAGGYGFALGIAAAVFAGAAVVAAVALRQRDGRRSRRRDPPTTTKRHRSTTDHSLRQRRRTTRQHEGDPT